MGGCQLKKEKESETIPAMNKAMFQFQYIIGKGGFGKVWKVEYRRGRKWYAMKEMSKSRIIAKRSVNSVMNERKILSQLQHDFLVNMRYAFQDGDNLYLVMDLLTGGDLRFHISRKRRFTEEQTKFFLASILQGLEYIHSNGILHRDIKPENMVMDEDGYLRITDFGIARIWHPDNSQDTSGTPGYMAPEVMCRQNHGVAADYFAMGVIGYECMLGRRPYQGRTRKEIRDQILARQITIRKHEIPPNWTESAADFINRLLQRKPMNRLGLHGPTEVKSHSWFKDFPFTQFDDRTLLPPFLPTSKEGNYDSKNINENWKDNQDVLKQNAILLRRDSVQSLFNGYYYDFHVFANPILDNKPKQLKRRDQNTQQINAAATTAPMTGLVLK